MRISLASPWRMRERVLSTNASSDPMRIGSGRTMLAQPASQQPRMIVISERDVGPRMATWSPGTRPRACKLAATTSASSCTCLHGTKESPSAGCTLWPTKRTPVGRSAAAIRRETIESGSGMAVDVSPVLPRQRCPPDRGRRRALPAA